VNSPPLSQAPEATSSDPDGFSSVSGWAASAEEACMSIYQTRGSAPWASSRDYHDNMTLYFMWFRDLLSRTVDALTPIGGSTPESDALIQDMAHLSEPANEEAGIESKHYLYNQRQDEIDAEVPQVEAAIRSRADALGVPTCGEIAIGNSEGWG